MQLYSPALSSLLQFLCLKKKIVNMAVDCAWIGTTSIFQLGMLSVHFQVCHIADVLSGAAISSTINGAASCHPSCSFHYFSSRSALTPDVADISVCASSVLLVPATWFTCVLGKNGLRFCLVKLISWVLSPDLFPCFICVDYGPQGSLP